MLTASIDNKTISEKRKQFSVKKLCQFWTSWSYLWKWKI